MKKKHDAMAIICLLAIGALPAPIAGCGTDSANAVGSEQGLRGGDRDRDTDEAADEAARGAAGAGFNGDRDRDMDEDADEAAVTDADAGPDHECRDGDGHGGHHDKGRTGSRDAGSWSGARR